MTEDRVESHATIPAPARVVWALLTEPEHLGSWFSDAGAQVDLRPGGTITISWKESGTARCVVERIQPERELTWRWAPTHDHGTGILEVPIYEMAGQPAEDGNSTLVEFCLSEDMGITTLHVVESGFASVDPRRMRGGRRRDPLEGWRIQLTNLAKYASDRLA